MNEKQQATVEQVLKEFRDGKLFTGNGDKVIKSEHAKSIAFGKAGIESMEDKKAAEQRLFLQNFGM